jgi:2-dehydro-3-deoxygluconokinase
MIRAVAIGEAMVELRPVRDGLYARAIAGDAYNAAVYLARSLGTDGGVAFLTGIGDEGLSAELKRHITDEGLNADLVFPVPGGLPGLYLIELDATGDRSFHYWRGQSAARRWFAELQAQGGSDRLDGCDLLYLSGISLAILPPEDRSGALAMLQRLKGRVGRIAFDPNVRPRLWTDLSAARAAVEAAVSVADIVLPSEVDGRLIWDEPEIDRQLDRYRALGAGEVALTCGAEGAWLRAEGLEAHLPAPPTTVVDTSGAGDSFNGAYLAARLHGAGPREAAAAGLALAARVVAFPGALIGAEHSHPAG